MVSGHARQAASRWYSYPHAFRVRFRLPGASIVLRTNVLAVFLAAAAGSAIAQTCNPAIDGTYCQDNMQRAPAPSTAPGVRTMTGIQPGEMFSISNDDNPGMLGAITFNSDGSRCIGLIRRSNCRQ